MTLNRKTTVKKLKTMPVRLTEEEHKYVKKLAIDRGWTVTRFVLECVRTYIKEKT